MKRFIENITVTLVTIFVILNTNIINASIYELILSDNDSNTPTFLFGQRLEIYVTFSRHMDSLNLENEPLDIFSPFLHKKLRNYHTHKTFFNVAYIVLKIKTNDIPKDILNKFETQDTMPEYKYILFGIKPWQELAFKEFMEKGYKYVPIINIERGGGGFLISYLGIYDQNQIEIIKNTKNRKDIEDILIKNPYILSIY